MPRRVFCLGAGYEALDQAIEDNLQLRGQGAEERDLAALGGPAENQAMRVQKMATEMRSIPAGAIDDVTIQGMADIGEMHPHLMGSTRQGVNSYQRQRLESLATSNSVTAARPSFPYRTAMRLRCRGSLPIAASILPCDGVTLPYTRAR